MLLRTPASLVFHQDAETYYHISDQIVQQLLPYLTAVSCICDAACGTGHLALALAERGYRVEAIDSDTTALSVLEDALTERPELPVTIREIELSDYHPRVFFTDMVFAFYGSPENALSIAKQQCSGRVYMIENSWKAEGSVFIEELTRRGVTVDELFFEVEMGQPFRTLSDAALYFLLYGQEEDLLSDAELEARLIKTDDPVFPYTLPVHKELGLLTLDMTDLRKHY